MTQNPAYSPDQFEQDLRALITKNTDVAFANPDSTAHLLVTLARALGSMCAITAGGLSKPVSEVLEKFSDVMTREALNTIKRHTTEVQDVNSFL
jgi:hypothetical protein